MTALRDDEELLMERASEWHAIMHSGDVDERTRSNFERWLHSNREHKRVYRDFEQIYCDLDFVSVAAGVDLDSDLQRSKKNWMHRIKWSFLRGIWSRPVAFPKAIAGVVLAITLLFIYGPILINNGQNPIKYETKTAEVRDITLSDGTIVTLGAKSVLETTFADDMRKVKLYSGEAFFNVAKNKSRPFYVSVNDTLVRVVGTQFDVRSRADMVHVAVLEGVVEVMKPRDISEKIDDERMSKLVKRRLVAGQMVSAQRSVALPEVKLIEDEVPGAWRDGNLVYDNVSLAEIITDVNRYSIRPIRLASYEIGQLRYTVAFKAVEINQFLDVISNLHPIEVDKSSEGQIILRLKNKKQEI